MRTLPTPEPSAGTRRSSGAGRRVGYLIGVAVNAALLYLINVAPGWQAVPFLTDGMTAVLPILNVSLWIGLLANVVYLVTDPPWLRTLGDLVTTSVGFVVLLRLWQEFPFTFADAGWAWLVRLGLVVVLLGPGSGSSCCSSGWSPAGPRVGEPALVGASSGDR